MKNYKIQIEPGEQESVLTILEESNDVIIDNVTNDDISFTIELDDEEADLLYNDILKEVEVRVFSLRGRQVIL